MSIALTIKATNGDKYAVEVTKAGTVAELKQALEAKSSIAASLQRLIYKGLFFLVVGRASCPF
jgi:hypothetical protein